MSVPVIESIDRPPETLVDAFRGASSADVHEAMGKSGAMAPVITPATDATEICGPAVTVRLPPGDNMMIHVAAKLATPGDVLVIAASTTRAATWGELATKNALQNGLEGVVSDGNVRDVERIEDLNFPVFSRAVSQSGATKKTPGPVNVPVSVGGLIVDPGDIVVGDADGITVVPQDKAERVINAFDEKETQEEAIRERIEDGEELFDILLGDDGLDDHDVDVIEGPFDHTTYPSG